MNSSRKSLLRQWFVMVPTILYSFDIGMIVGFPSVLSTSLSNNSTDIIFITEEQLSWFASSLGIVGLPSIFFLSYCMQTLGRKFIQVMMNSILVIGWIVISSAKSFPALIAGRSIQGIINASLYIVPLIVSEMTHPKRRGYFQTIKKLAIAVGTFFCHVLGTLYGWRAVAFASVVPVAIATVLSIFCPESPAWLASKGRYAESERSFAWLNADDEERHKELELLILSQKERRKSKLTCPNQKMKVLKKLQKRDFLKAFYIVSVLTVLMEAVGKNYFAAYAVQIMVTVIQDDSMAAYCTALLDLVIIIGLTLSCFVVRRFKRRTLIISSGIVAVVLLSLLSIVFYLTSISIIPSNLRWISAALLILYNLITNIGMIPICYAIMGEIYPLEHRGVGSSASGAIFTAMFAINLKMNPAMLKHLGVHGTFSIYNITTVISLIYLYYMLPETKDRTLQDIENELGGREFWLDVTQSAVENLK